MPYSDPEERRRYDRDRKRALRAAPAPAVTLAVSRLEVVEDVQEVLAEAVRLVRTDPKARGIEKGRALGYLGTIALRLIETRDLQDRMDALERLLDRTNRRSAS